MPPKICNTVNFSCKINPLAVRDEPHIRVRGHQGNSCRMGKHLAESDLSLTIRLPIRASNGISAHHKPVCPVGREYEWQLKQCLWSKIAQRIRYLSQRIFVLLNPRCLKKHSEPTLRANRLQLEILRRYRLLQVHLTTAGHDSEDPRDFDVF